MVICDGWMDRQTDITNYKRQRKAGADLGTVRRYDRGNLIAVSWVVRESYALLAKDETGESQVRAYFIDLQ